MHAAALAAIAMMIGSAAWQAYGYAQERTVNLTYTSGRGASPDQSADTDLGFFEAVSDTAATSSTSDEIAMIGPNIESQMLINYAIMNAEGTYTPEGAARIGGQMAAAAASVKVSHPTYDLTSLNTTADTSRARTDRYKQDMGEAFKPLAGNTRPEFEPFALYVETKEERHLTTLRAIAASYRESAVNGLAVEVPADAALLHVNTLNAMQAYAAVIDALAANADEPITSATLLVSFNSAENDLRAALSAYEPYYASK